MNDLSYAAWKRYALALKAYYDVCGVIADLVDRRQLPSATIRVQEGMLGDALNNARQKLLRLGEEDPGAA